jgi:hypothetical protein
MSARKESSGRIPAEGVTSECAAGFAILTPPHIETIKSIAGKAKSLNVNDNHYQLYPS